MVKILDLSEDIKISRQRFSRLSFATQERRIVETSPSNPKMFKLLLLAGSFCLVATYVVDPDRKPLVPLVPEEGANSTTTTTTTRTTTTMTWTTTDPDQTKTTTTTTKTANATTKKTDATTKKMDAGPAVVPSPAVVIQTTTDGWTLFGQILGGIVGTLTLVLASLKFYQKWKADPNRDPAALCEHCSGQCLAFLRIWSNLRNRTR